MFSMTKTYTQTPHIITTCSSRTVSSLTRFNMDVYLQACSKERLNTQLKLHLSLFSISRSSKRCFAQNVSTELKSPPVPPQETNLPWRYMWPFWWGLADGDQVQLTKSWQQNLALQHLGVLGWNRSVDVWRIGEWMLGEKLFDGANFMIYTRLYIYINIYI